MTRALHLIAWLSLAALAASCEPAYAAPNILIVFSDDHGWADLGAHGVDSDVATPNIDQLAREGVLAVRGYVTAPQCIPSRVALIMGAYQQRYGVEDNDDENVLPNTATTLADRLSAAGYKTGLVGKWHIADGTAGWRPEDYGFAERCFSRALDYLCNTAPDGTPLLGVNQAKYAGAPAVTTETQEALYFLQRRQADGLPWMLLLTYNAPHSPAVAYEPWYSQTSPALPELRRQALSSIAAMDDGVRQLREQIAAMGQTDDTLVFFVGDNGAQGEPAWNGSLNTPLVGRKGMLTDGGIREPYVAAWPGTWRAGQVIAAPISSLDVAATAVAAAGITDTSGLDGQDLTPYLGGCLPDAAYPWAPCARQPNQTLYWRWNEQAAVVRWPYKFIQLGADAGTHYQMLFDLTRPDGEQHGADLVSGKPQVAARLKAQLEAWAATLLVPGLHPSPSTYYTDMFREFGVLPPAP